MPEYRYDWFTGNIPTLTTLLERFKGAANIEALEIGCFEGRSTIWFLENILTHISSKITCIDTFEGSADHRHFKVDVSGCEEQFRANIKPFGKKVIPIKGPSNYVLKEMGKDNDWADFIYLDGSHLAPDVLEDAVLSWTLLKPGGIMIFDDYLWKNMPNPLDNPAPGIDAFLSVYSGKYRELLRGYQIAIQKL